MNANKPRVRGFDTNTVLEWTEAAREVVQYRRAERIFSQGDAGHSVMYIQKGRVKLSVVSRAGKEATVAVLGPGDFFGEGTLAGQSVRIGTATAITRATVLVIDKDEMFRLLHAEHALSDRFIAYMLHRNIRIEQDLIGRLFSSSEKRLARALLLLARYGKRDKPQRVLPKLSKATLAEMAGSSPARTTAFMNKFKRMGFIEDDSTGITINNSLLSVVLHD